MRKYFKSIVYLFVFACVCAAHAGSYEDFFIAIKRDTPGPLLTLLQRGFDANTLNPDGLHALYLAINEPSPKVTQVLLDWPKTNVETLNAAGESPLMMAAIKGQMDVARKLIARDADVNKTGWTPLHYAASRGQVEMMQLLLDNHAYIDAESPNKTTPLMMAAAYGSEDSVKFLLDAGADTAPKNMLGLSAIDFAQKSGRPTVVAMIAGAIRGQQPKGRW